MKKIKGNSERLRLCVYRSLKHIYAQIIDDERGHTLVAVSTLSPWIREKIKGLKKVDQARVVGEEIAKKALSVNIKKIVFDRNDRKYHGRVKALAEGARSKGLEF